MKKTSFALIIIAAMFIFPACSEGTDVVESGTYQGTIDEVEADKTEIYVLTDDDKRLELYFTGETSLTRDGEEVEFSKIEKGMKVEVEVEKTGKRLDPVSVKILE